MHRSFVNMQADKHMLYVLDIHLYNFTDKEDDENGSRQRPFLALDHTSCALIQMFDRHANLD